MHEKLHQEIMQVIRNRFPDIDSTDILLTGSLSNAYHAMRSVFERAYAELGVTPSSMDVLVVLYIKKGCGCTLSEISKLLVVSCANITGLVEGLVRKGLANRTAHPADRRKFLAEITPAGIELMEMLIPESACFLQDVFAPLPSEKKQKFYQCFTQMASLLLPYREKGRVRAIKRPAPTG